jgi:hypothetical protein
MGSDKMDIYLLTYDNGEPYDMNDTYTIGVFDDIEKAYEFCIKKGFKETETKGFFKKEGSTWGSKVMYESISIDKIQINKELDINGEVVIG